MYMSNKGWSHFTALRKDQSEEIQFDVAGWYKCVNFADPGRGVRVVEGARLESVYRSKAYRGFESRPLRQTQKP